MTPALTRVSRGSPAEAVILALCAGYLGQDKRGAGLLVTRLGGLHTPRCQRGYYVQAGDSLRGGQPCSERCQQVNDALDQAEAWLKAHERPAATERPAPVQLRMEGTG